MNVPSLALVDDLEIQERRLFVVNQIFPRPEEVGEHGEMLRSSAEILEMAWES